MVSNIQRQSLFATPAVPTKRFLSTYPPRNIDTSQAKKNTTLSPTLQVEKQQYPRARVRVVICDALSNIQTRKNKIKQEGEPQTVSR